MSLLYKSFLIVLFSLILTSCGSNSTANNTNSIPNDSSLKEEIEENNTDNSLNQNNDIQNGTNINSDNISFNDGIINIDLTSDNYFRYFETNCYQNVDRTSIYIVPKNDFIINDAFIEANICLITKDSIDETKKCYSKIFCKYEVPKGGDLHIGCENTANGLKFYDSHLLVTHKIIDKNCSEFKSDVISLTGDAQLIVGNTYILDEINNDNSRQYFRLKQYGPDHPSEPSFITANKTENSFYINTDMKVTYYFEGFKYELNVKLDCIGSVVLDITDFKSIEILEKITMDELSDSIDQTNGKVLFY